MHKMIGPRKAPKQKRSKERFQKILEITFETIAEIGYENTTTDLIASRSGISVGSLYQFFPNKETIIFAVAEETYLKLHGIFFKKIKPIVETYRKEKSTKFTFALASEILVSFEETMEEVKENVILQSILYTHPKLLELDFKSNERFAKTLVQELFVPLFPKLSRERSLVISRMTVEIVDAVYRSLLRNPKSSAVKQRQAIAELNQLLGFYFQSFR
jgi:AcrR family transcriptional regulator